VATASLSDNEQVIEIVESNRQREKTMVQKAREFARLSEAKAALARKRQGHGTTTRGKSLTKKSPQAKRAPTAKDEAAAVVGLSRPTAEKALVVVEKIDEAVAAGDQGRAQVLRETLNEKSVEAAHKLVVPKAATTSPNYLNGMSISSLKHTMKMVGSSIAKTKLNADLLGSQLTPPSGNVPPGYGRFSKAVKELESAWAAWKRKIKDDSSDAAEVAVA
jgi:hypothetical protein